MHSRLAYTIILFAGFLAGIPIAVQAQHDETLTISTYYPSPYGVYRRLEVKRALAVGGAGFSTVNSLSSGQMFVNNSIILNNLTSLPGPAVAKEGQLIYYTGGGEHMLKYRTNTQWLNATCPVGRQCLRPNTDDSCPLGQVCQKKLSCSTIYFYSATSSMTYSCVNHKLDCLYSGTSVSLPDIWTNSATPPCMTVSNCCAPNHPDYTAIPQPCYGGYSATAQVCN
jgi:hypothetical protein